MRRAAAARPWLLRLRDLIALFGMVAAMPGAAGRRGWRATRTPCPPAPGPGGCGPAPAQPGHADRVQHGLELWAVAPLPGGDHDGQRFLALLAGQVNLGGQPAAGPAQPVIGGLAAGRLGLQIPLFRAPAACWCARVTVESTDTSQVISPAASARACNAVRIPAQVPSRCQRRNNPYTDCHGPYAAAHPATAHPPGPATGSRRSAAVSSTPAGGPASPRGSNGSSTAHCASVRSALPSPLRWP